MLYEFVKVNSHFSNNRNSVRLHRFYKRAFIALKIEEKVKIVVPVKTYAYPKHANLQICQIIFHSAILA
jgi:hypothetical protein